MLQTILSGDLKLGWSFRVDLSFYSPLIVSPLASHWMQAVPREGTRPQARQLSTNEGNSCTGVTGKISEDSRKNFLDGIEQNVLGTKPFLLHFHIPFN